ncbi:MAG: glycosyltransferase family 9 protein [Desulfovibrionaceae bacterium]|nr:glycosyltransferase family 9 protein [Desulfovibrionaceae bacterium]MBF0514252.1 glycosyltransferase family 9 protein [Desulfovibrionaceae bacterium]
MNTLVLNLTRFGDLIQTQPVIAALAARGDKTAVLCLENFLPATGLLGGLDAVFALPGSALLTALDHDWPNALAILDALVADIAARFAPERLINLTSSIPARLLAKLLADRLKLPEVAGFCVDEHGFSLDSSPWAAFLQAASSHRGASPFNLCDLFFRAAHLDGAKRPFTLAAPPAALQKDIAAKLRQACPEASGFIALQLGASEDRRRWPVAGFARFAAILHERLGLVPVLLGSGNETNLGDKFAALYPGAHVNCIGQTGFPELAAALLACRMLATNDTGTMHLAAGLGLPVLAFFLATAQPFDTAPYAENILCLEPDLACHPCPFGAPCGLDQTCRQAIRAENAAAWAAGFLETGRWQGPAIPKTRAWITRRDRFGQMTLSSPTGDDASDRAKWLAIQRHFFRQFLDGLPLTPPDGPAPDNPLAASLKDTLGQARLILTLLREQGKLLLSLPRDKAKTKFLATWQRLHALFSGSPNLAALAFLWTEHSHRADTDLHDFLAQAQRFADLVEAMVKIFE